MAEAWEMKLRPFSFPGKSKKDEVLTMHQAYVSGLSYDLTAHDIETAPPERNALWILTNGRAACHEELNKNACIFPDDLRSPEVAKLYDKVVPFSGEVREYLLAIERAPLLNDATLDGNFFVLAQFNGRYAYSIITAMQWGRGYHINHRRIYLFRRVLGLKVPEKQPKHRCLWLNDGGYIWLCAAHTNYVWSHDIVETRTDKVRKIKSSNLIGEYTWECLTSYKALRIQSEDVLYIFPNVMRKKGLPKYLRSGKGSEFIAKHLREWILKMEVAPMYIMPGIPWENCYVEMWKMLRAYTDFNAATAATKPTAFLYKKAHHISRAHHYSHSNTSPSCGSFMITCKV